MSKKTILVTVEGGVIQNIDDIPPGVRVVVRDYCIQEGDAVVWQQTRKKASATAPRLVGKLR